MNGPSIAVLFSPKFDKTSSIVSHPEIAIPLNKVLVFLQTVPKGTNGAISKLGTLAGALGGLFMGVVFWIAR